MNYNFLRNQVNIQSILETRELNKFIEFKVITNKNSNPYWISKNNNEYAIQNFYVYRFIVINYLLDLLHYF